MVKNELVSIIGPELQSLPLQIILSSAMNGIVAAQQISANTTADFIKNTTGVETFETNVVEDGKEKKVTITVPRLAIIPIPALQVDSATVHFSFEIKEVLAKSTDTTTEGKLDVSAKGLLKAFVDASISGSVTHKSTSENTLNRSGLLDISIHLSQPPVPDGLNKVLSFLGNAIHIDNPTAPTP